MHRPAGKHARGGSDRAALCVAKWIEFIHQFKKEKNKECDDEDVDENLNQLLDSQKRLDDDLRIQIENKNSITSSNDDGTFLAIQKVLCCWLLVVGCWFLVCWLLVVGCWLLIVFFLDW